MNPAALPSPPTRGTTIRLTGVTVAGPILKRAYATNSNSNSNRGKCYLPSLELWHTYRLLSEHVDGSPNTTSLRAFDPSKHKDLRAPRSPDAGVHEDMMYCEFKGCTIMVYGRIAKPPIGTNLFPGWVPRFKTRSVLHE